MKRKLFYMLPATWRPMARRIYYSPLDSWNKLFGKDDDLVPPKGEIYVGAGDFKKQGKQFFALFTKHALLKANHKVLDVGSGIGRMAVPFMDFISDQGAYHGFDVVEEGVKWCTDNITSRKPNFQFVHADIKNDLYNIQGKIKSEDFTFPYPSEMFDFVFLTSVFTHMMPTEVAHYLKEIERVLAKNGRVLMTCFILNDESQHLISNGKSTKAFPHREKDYALMDAQVNSANIAFDEKYFLSLIEAAGLTIDGNLYGGWWCGRAKDHEYQDYFILKKA